MSWDDLIHIAAIVWKNKSISATINKLILGALVYFIWQERNWRLFQNKRRSPAQLVTAIEDNIHLKIMGLRLRDNSRVRDAMHLGNIPVRAFFNPNDGA